MRQRYVLDTSVLVSIVNSDDAEYFSCYSFFQNLHDEDKAIWVVPGVIFSSFRLHNLDAIVIAVLTIQCSDMPRCFIQTLSYIRLRKSF